MPDQIDLPKPVEPSVPRLMQFVAWGTLLAAIAHLGWLLLDWSRCFQDAEVYANWAGDLLVGGKSIARGDLRNAFSVWSEHGNAGLRFLSYLFTIWTMKLRLALWNFLPPHPSFGPAWFFSLLLAPGLLYRFLRGELGCRWTALLGAGLYMVTAGYLSAASLMFHPGKPLTNVVVIGTLYMASQANRSIRARGPSATVPRLPAPMAGYLVLIMPALLFVDETALFALAIPPVWNFRFFMPRRGAGPGLRSCLRNWACFSVAPLVYLGAVLALMPRLSHSKYGGSFDLASYLLEVFGKFDVRHLLQHLTTLLGAVLVPWPALKTGIPIASAPVHGGFYLAGCLAVFSWLGWHAFAAQRHRSFCARLGILLLLYLLFQTFVAAHHPLDLVVSGYYYGAIFSVLIAMVLAIGLAALLRDVRLRGWAIALVCYVLVIQTFNFSRLNDSWRAHSRAKSMGWLVLFTYNPFFAYSDLSQIDKLFAGQKGVYVDDIPATGCRGNLKWVAGLWRRRAGGYREYLGRRPLALEDLWCLSEFYYWRTPGRIPAAAGELGVEESYVRSYRAAVARARLGQPDEEPLPVLAFRKMAPGEFDKRGLMNTRLSYPFVFREIYEGTQHMRRFTNTHWLAPLAGEKGGSGPYWIFHDQFMQALADKRLYEYGIIAVGQTNIAGQEQVVLDMRR